MADFPGIPDELSGSLQENVVALAASSDKYCKLVVLNVPLELYSNKVYRDLATAIYNYIHLYGTAPKEHLVDLVEGKLDGKDGETMRTILEQIHGLLQGFNEKFVVNSLHQFVRQQHLKKLAVPFYQAIEQGDTSQADSLIDGYRRTSYEQFSPGLTLKEFVADLGKVDKTLPCVPLGIPELDRHDLGPARGELHLLLAPPKRGKTWWLLHVTKQALLARMRTVYVTLEVSPEIIAGRLIQSFFSMSRRDGDRAEGGRFDIDSTGRLTGIRLDSLNRPSIMSKDGISKIKKGFGGNSQIERMSENLRIQSFPTGQLKLKELSAYLENLVTFHRFMPDVVILDYADLMYLDLRNYRLALGLLYKDLRGLAVQRNFAMVTASQSNRASLSARTITEKHAAEDISKIAISDVAFTYNQTPEEREMQVARLFVAAARNSPDKWSVGITQAYGIGQFCTGSVSVNNKLWVDLLPKVGSRRDEEEEASEDE